MTRTWRLLCSSAAVLMASATLAACGDDDEDKAANGGSAGTPAAKTGGEATFNYPSFPDYLDPAMSYTVAGWQALVPTYTTLVTYKREKGAEGAKLIPGLAEDLPEVSEDGKTYTFTLREGLKYSDGTPVKASDFEHTIKRVIKLESGGASFYTSTIAGAEKYLKAKGNKGDISGITADEAKRQITIKLTDPNGQFPYILSMPFAGLVPGDTEFEVLTKNPPPGVGPLKISKVTGSRRFILEKNENYPDLPGVPAAKLDRITVNVVSSNERSIRDVLQNRADWMDDPSAGDALREFKNTASDRYREETTNSTYYYFLNHRVKPFDNAEVRKAVHFAIDKRALARLFGGQLTPGCNFLPPGMQGHEQIDPCPFGDPNAAPQVDKAKQMVQKAGVAGDSVTVWGNDEEQTRAVTEYLADVLNQIGFKAKPKIVDGEVYFQTIGNQKTKAQAGFANWFQDFPHPGNFLFLVDPDSIQETNNQNFSNVDDREIKTKLDELDKLPLEEAAAGYAELDRRIVENADVIPYGHRKLPVFFSDRINADAVLFHPVLQTDFTTFSLKG
ncbi:MAG TPA: ABC transporter substrate-binding protein [Baekduia sp.]|nr:ABC transporter substrate-binding protein [Baekduia sp.]